MMTVKKCMLGVVQCMLGAMQCMLGTEAMRRRREHVDLVAVA